MTLYLLKKKNGISILSTAYFRGNKQTDGEPLPETGDRRGTVIVCLTKSTGTGERAVFYGKWVLGRQKLQCTMYTMVLKIKT